MRLKQLLTKQVLVAEASSSVVGSATVNEVSGDDGASSSSTDHVSRDTNEKVIEDLKDHTFHKYAY
ncbi:hypothetical protein HPULCUR_001583 [Helicostylum pulchrum]|uniref:Uncharacterized protein n=1 Tax=Helicostylum pulchrum TaxID=562976 RepID=A0ABP9XN40_9FUNG